MKRLKINAMLEWSYLFGMEFFCCVFAFLRPYAWYIWSTLFWRFIHSFCLRWQRISHIEMLGFKSKTCPLTMVNGIAFLFHTHTGIWRHTTWTTGESLALHTYIYIRYWTNSKKKISRSFRKKNRWKRKIEEGDKPWHSFMHESVHDWGVFAWLQKRKKPRQMEKSTRDDSKIPYNARQMDDQCCSPGYNRMPFIQQNPCSLCVGRTGAYLFVSISLGWKIK